MNDFTFVPPVRWLIVNDDRARRISIVLQNIVARALVSANVAPAELVRRVHDARSARIPIDTDERLVVPTDTGGKYRAASQIFEKSTNLFGRRR